MSAIARFSALGLVALLVAAWTARPSEEHPAPLARTKSGNPVRWVSSDIVVQPSPRSPGMDEKMVFHALESGIRAWNGALQGCRAPKLRLARVAQKPWSLRRDTTSVVVVRDRSWCPDGAPNRDACYESSRFAITHLYPNEQPGSPRDGELDEADIEVNAVNVAWSLDGEVPGTRSLRALMAHELGHVLGLDHSCARGPSAGSPGSSLRPSCHDESARRSIMYPDAIEDGREPVVAPGPAEAAALCELYR